MLRSYGDVHPQRPVLEGATEKILRNKMKDRPLRAKFQITTTEVKESTHINTALTGISDIYTRAGPHRTAASDNEDVLSLPHCSVATNIRRLPQPSAPQHGTHAHNQVSHWHSVESNKFLSTQHRLSHPTS